MIEPYSHVDVAKTVVIAADHTFEYLMVGHQGQLVKLLDNYDFKKNRKYRALIKAFPNVNVWPITFNFPTYEKLNNGSERLIFRQMLLDGCLSCERVGWMNVAYDFSRDGQFRGIKILGIQ